MHINNHDPLTSPIEKRRTEEKEKHEQNWFSIEVFENELNVSFHTYISIFNIISKKTAMASKLLYLKHRSYNYFSNTYNFTFTYFCSWTVVEMVEILDVASVLCTWAIVEIVWPIPDTVLDAADPFLPPIIAEYKNYY